MVGSVQRRGMNGTKRMVRGFGLGKWTEKSSRMEVISAGESSRRSEAAGRSNGV